MAALIDWFNEAQKHHQAQRFSEAEAFYRRVIDEDPSHMPSWHHLGLVCMAQNRLPEAAAAFQHAIGLSPDHVETLTQLGIVLARQNRLPEAVSRFQRAIELRPDHAKAHNNLGVAFTQLGRLEEGLACYREAARLQPDYAEAHFNLGIAHGDRRQHEQALACYERALQIRPDYADALFNLGLILVHERRPGEAVVCLEHAVRLRPENPEAYNNLSMALADLGQFQKAVEACDTALKLRPQDAKTHMNRGNALSSLGRVDEAIACYDLAIRLQPDYPNVRWNRSLAWLVQGKYQRGWEEYEWRWKRAETKLRHFPEPRWDGGPLAGKTILLWCEQGLGDIIQFVRYAALLKERGATVWLECQSKMAALFATCRSIDRLLPEGTPLPAGFDFQIPVMSLPHLAGTTLENVPAPTPYLHADPDKIASWRKKLGTSSRIKIGVAWQGNPKHRFDQHRSFPLQWLRLLSALAGVELFSLQKGFGIEQIKTVRFPIVELGNQLDEGENAFIDTAAVMHALDLIVTCDSSLAHLAGALGRPTWLALSTPADWRWMEEVEDTPWYPTMRLFRQAKLGDWRSVFEPMREELGRQLSRSPASIQLEVAPGELLDKFTILQIKSERITDPAKLQNVRAELRIVDATRRQILRSEPWIEELTHKLKQVNESLWDIENRIRDCEKRQDFGEQFIALARTVYQTNDRRSEIKRQLNERLGAKFREEKEYHGQ